MKKPPSTRTLARLEREAQARAEHELRERRRAHTALHPTLTPDDPNEAPRREGLGWTAHWTGHVGLFDPLLEKVHRAVNSHGSHGLPATPPTEKPTHRRSGSQGCIPMFDSRLEALTWMRGEAERSYGKILADLDDAIAAERLHPTNDGWTPELAAAYLRGPE